MTFKNYKEGTGVRARTDLSANAVPGDDGRMSLETFAKAADWLAGEVQTAKKRGSTHVFLPTNTADRLVSVMLEIVNRES